MNADGLLALVRTLERLAKAHLAVVRAPAPVDATPTVETLRAWWGLERGDNGDTRHEL